MVPSAVVLLESLPLNANGKIDRSALPKPKMNATVPPATDLESRIASIWAAVLRLEKVGVEANFFDTFAGRSASAVWSSD
jgi:hypothetical protein